MKICPKCNIKVGGITDICPICQNGLEGESNNEYYWPPEIKLKKASLFYKIQLLVVLVSVVICLGLDYLFELHGKLHWGMIVAIWGIAFELILRRLIKRFFILSQVIGRIIISIILLILITARFAGFWYIATAYIVPIIILVALVTFFVLALVDKGENAMVYLLCSILGGIVPFIGILLIERKTPFFWSICVMTSMVVVIGIAIFRGRKMLLEIRKRTNI